MARYITKQKRELIDFLTRNSSRSFTVEEICRGMEADPRYISPPGRSTVYRLIPKLLDEKKIRHFSSEEGRRQVYQIMGGMECAGHMHLKCTACGRLYHVSVPVSMALSSEIEQTENFKVSAGETVIFGTCSHCLKGDKK